MEIAMFTVGALCAIFGIVAGVLFSTLHRDSGIWLSCAAVCLAVVGGFCWFQDRVWKKDADAASVAASKEPSVLLVENMLVLPKKEGEPLRIKFGLMNRGDTDATATFKDRTYYFSTDPSQTVFKYLPTESMETPVPAIANAVCRGEMRFDMVLTPEKLAALNEGKARLFFFARGEYRDASGKAYPLPYAAMYDQFFDNHLVSCPKEILFE